jgi:hypothetical protein
MSVRLMVAMVVAVSAGASVPPAVAQQPAPVGSETQVNTYTTGSQGAVAVATDGAGNFVVVWESAGSAESDTSIRSIQGQRYDSTGTPAGAQFQVNTYTTGEQGSPSVATDGGGNFVVVWESYGSVGSDTSYRSIQGQRYDRTGTPVGAQFQVNTYTTGHQRNSAVVSDGVGSFVAWQSEGGAGSDTSDLSIQGQRYDGSGTPQGGEFQVNTYTTGDQEVPAVTTDGAGNFVVLWESYGSAGSDTSGESIQGQRYDGSGTPQGGEFQVNTYTTGDQTYAAVASYGAGSFVVVWQSDPGAASDASTRGIQGQRYDGAGTPQGSQFQVNTYTTENQFTPAVASDGAESFVVSWDSGSAGSDTSDLSVQAQRFDVAGTPQGGQFQVNTYTTGVQGISAVMIDGPASFMILWESDGSAASDASGRSVQQQRFAVPTTSSTSTTSTTLPTTDLLPGRSVVVRPGSLAKFVAKPSPGDTFTLPTSNPAVAGGVLRLLDLATTAGDDSYPLPAGTAWKGLGKPAGSKGFKYTGAGTPGDPCAVVLVKPSVIKGVCRGAGITLAPPFAGDVGVALSVGTTDRYCALFGGKSVKNDAKVTKRKKAPAPGACPP